LFGSDLTSFELPRIQLEIHWQDTHPIPFNAVMSGLAFPETAFDDDRRIYDDQPAFPTNAIHHQRWQHDP
jgi:hypothetical protein